MESFISTDYLRVDEPVARNHIRYNIVPKYRANYFNDKLHGYTVHQ